MEVSTVKEPGHLDDDNSASVEPEMNISAFSKSLVWTRVVVLLIERDAAVGARGINNSTPLHLASAKGNQNGCQVVG